MGGPKSSDWCPHERKEREVGDRHRGEPQRRPSDFRAELGAMCLLPASNRKGGWQPPEAGEKPGRDPSSKVPAGINATLTLTSGLRSSERIHFYCFRLPTYAPLLQQPWGPFFSSQPLIEWPSVFQGFCDALAAKSRPDHLSHTITPRGWAGL